MTTTTEPTIDEMQAELEQLKREYPRKYPSVGFAATPEVMRQAHERAAEARVAIAELEARIARMTAEGARRRAERIAAEAEPTPEILAAERAYQEAREAWERVAAPQRAAMAEHSHAQIDARIAERTAAEAEHRLTQARASCDTLAEKHAEQRQREAVHAAMQRDEAARLAAR